MAEYSATYFKTGLIKLSWVDKIKGHNIAEFAQSDRKEAGKK
jgi:hypothetical protein